MWRCFYFSLMSLCFFCAGFLKESSLFAHGHAKSYAIPGNIGKVLHISFHKGCIKEIEGVGLELGISITSYFVPDKTPGEFDPLGFGVDLYNIDHARAQRIWDQNRAYFDEFDAVITSDTVALSRIFLQNGWNKPLIIWVCNRFDYANKGTGNSKFPDREFYDLMRRATENQEVRIVAYTPFEKEYAKSKGVVFGNLLIKPCAPFVACMGPSAIPSEIVKEETFFVPPYHNETNYMSLASHLRGMGIPSFCGRYNGPTDLAGFKGIIHIPYAWSNFAFFENIAQGLHYFVPSYAFMRKLAKKPNFWFQDLRYFERENLYKLAEWYAPEHSSCITYFDSWDDLKNKIHKANYSKLRQEAVAYAKKHKRDMLTLWRKLFRSYS